MRKPLAATVLTAAILASTATGLPAPPRAPGEPGSARSTVTSRPQPAGRPSPAPGPARHRGRDPTAPPAAWRELERASAADTSTSASAQPALPLPPLPAVLPPPPPLQASPAPRGAQPSAGPAVEYLGLVEGPAGTYVILRVDGQLHVVQPGQVAAGVRLISATQERVQIRVRGTLKRLEPGGRTGP